MKAVIIGAGLAGLSSAYRLQNAGWQVVVLEAEDTVGGRTSSYRKDGYLLERGATQLSTGYEAYIRLATEIGMSDQIAECSNAIMLMRGGRLYEIDGARPLSVLLSGALSLRSKLLMIRAIRDYLKLKPDMDVLDISALWREDTESAAEYCAKRLNTQIFDVLVDPLMRTYTNNGGANVSALEWFSGLGNLAGKRMLAMRGGIDRLPAMLASKLDVQVSRPVTSVRTKAGGVEVIYDGPQGSGTIDADACVVATRLPEAYEIVPELHGAMDPLASKLKYNRSIVVHLGYAKRVGTSALGVLVPTVEHAQIGLVWLDHNKLAETAPAGHSLVTCYFEESGIDSVDPDTDDNFIAIANDFVTRLFPELMGARDMGAVTRWKRAIPNPRPGIYCAIDEMKQGLNSRFPIQLAGDYFTCTGQNSAIHWGQIAADNIISHIERRNTPAA